jgi:two-component system, cell cycle response regulator CtrA
MISVCGVAIEQAKTQPAVSFAFSGAELAAQVSDAANTSRLSKIRDALLGAIRGCHSTAERKISLTIAYVRYPKSVFPEALGRNRVATICQPGAVAASKGAGMRVLLIEDDDATVQSIKLMLKSKDFDVHATDLGKDGIDLSKSSHYDVILLDLNLPDVPGFDVLRSLRASKVKTPVLILTGLAGTEDKVKGLSIGADDYLTKPFENDELIARIHAILRRSQVNAQSVIQTGDLVVNLDAKTIEVGGVPVHLTNKEYQLLELLTLRRGMTITKETFLSHLYGGMDEPLLKIVDVFMCKLRKKLADASRGKNYIETVWGRGYVMHEP